MFGILNIYKPKGLTSFDVVAKVRKALNIKQVGHTGTLDPLAQGVLPVCVGKATKLIEYFNSDKKYRASATLGITTDSYDLEGEVHEKKQVDMPSREEIKKVLKTFDGEIIQTPPIYSAIKVNGKKLYEYARNNIEIDEIPKRKVTIYNIELVETIEAQNPVIVFDVECSSGTYIRSIIQELGEKLGTGAVMSDLIRTKANGFCVEETIKIEDITPEKLLDPSKMVDLASLEIDKDELKKIHYGQFLEGKNFKDGEVLKLIYQDKLVAIAILKDGLIKPKKVFSW